VLDEHHTLYRNIGHEPLVLKELSEKYDIHQLKDLLEDYVKETRSKKAETILRNMEDWIPHFKKIVPGPYQEILERISHYEELGISEKDARMEAFHDLCRRKEGA